MITREDLERRFFYEVAPRREALTERALSQVTSWKWLRGLGNALDPEPLRWQRSGIPVARAVKSPPAPPIPPSHHEVGLDGEGRPWIVREHGGDPGPTIGLWLHDPGRIEVVRFPWNAGQPGVGPQVVGEMELDELGRVVLRSSFTSRVQWPKEGPPGPEDIAAFAAAQPWEVHHLRARFFWEGDRLVRVDERKADDSAWSPDVEIEWNERGRIAQIYKIDGFGKRVPLKKKR